MRQRSSLGRQLTAESLGAFFLFCGVVGSGIMGEQLAGGNTALALLANTLATGAILFVIIVMLAPISGAHFNPAVTLVAFVRSELSARDSVLFVCVQLAGGLAGVFAAHLMFDLDILQVSTRARTGIGQWAGEAIATFGLIMTILGTVRHKPDWVGPAVGLYIGAGYWFTSSTSFANPAITVGRAFSDTFSGISPGDVLPFIGAQLTGALVAALLGSWLFGRGN
jgi:glycerol uptake facilitator-like aquaporin